MQSYVIDPINYLFVIAEYIEETYLTASSEEDGMIVTAAKKKKPSGIATKTNPALWSRCKTEAKSRMGGKHSARAMQLAVKLYKQRGGGFRGGKPSAKTNKMRKWTKQKWMYLSDFKKKKDKNKLDDNYANDTKQKLYFLIGPPSVGKSQWIKDNNLTKPNALILNNDEVQESVAEKSSVKTYDNMFVTPPKELIPQEKISKEMLNNPEMENELNVYLNKLNSIANNYNNDPQNKEIILKFGPVVAFNKADFLDLLRFPWIILEEVNPFYYKEIKSAKKEASELFEKLKKENVKESLTIGKPYLIDMTNMSKEERDKHRKDILSIITGEESPDPQDINKYFEQIAIVFAPETGYSEEIIKQIKARGRQRAEEYKALGKNKTIPEKAYTNILGRYIAPSKSEGFSEIKFVGVPSLKSLREDQSSTDDNYATGRYLPLEKWKSLSPAEREATDKKKKREKQEQYVPNTEKAKVKSKYKYY
jgi:hypothetical protein